MHTQITLEERYAIMALKKQRYGMRAIARELGRAPSTVSRELRRNLRPSGSYTPSVAHQYAVARRRRSRRNSHFGPQDWALVRPLLERDCVIHANRSAETPACRSTKTLMPIRSERSDAQVTNR
jgi:IS30 family transposase